MDCPFCGKEMREGKIPCGMQLEWQSSEAVGAESEVVPLLGFLGGEIKASFCPDCRQIVLPVPEIERTLDKVQKNIDAVSEKIGALQKQWEARRTQEKERKKRENFGEKDPWEL